MVIQNLGNLEQKVMEIIWEMKKCTIRDVWQKLSKDKKIAYTTTATIIQRLQNKGLLERRRVGISFEYLPKVSQNTYTKNLARSFLKRFFTSFGEVAITSFADSIDKLPAKKRNYLVSLLNARK